MSFGAVCSLLVGLSYAVYSALYLKDPCRVSRSAHQFMKLYPQSRVYLWRARILGLGSAIALGAVPALSSLGRGLGPEWKAWLASLATFGFAFNSVSSFRTLQILPVVFADYEQASPEVQVALARMTSFIHLDPRGWFAFGGVGLWMLALNGAALADGTLPLPLAVAGILAGFSFCATVAAGVFHRYAMFTVIAASAGLVLAPLWFMAVAFYVH
jgi:hypothetical protein